MAGTSVSLESLPRMMRTISSSSGLLIFLLSLVLPPDVTCAVIRNPATSSPVRSRFSPIRNGLVARGKIPADADVAPTQRARANPHARALEGEDPYANYTVTEEVSKPIPVPADVTPCIVTLLQDQGFSAADAPVTVTYAPPPANTCGSTWQLVVLSFFSRVQGKQLNQLFTFTLADVLLLAATTATPTQTGLNFSVERDVTIFKSILGSPRSGVAELPNPVSDKYDGVYYVTLQLKFYPGTPPLALPDVVVPAPNSSFKVPRNVYKAKLQLYVSHFNDDEYYFADVPTSFYESLSEIDKFFIRGHGTCFREVVVYLDWKIVGVIYPKPILFSGFADLDWWRPFMGIGSLNMPLYTLDLTPVLALLLDGKSHNIAVRVTNAASGGPWIADGALLAWTDPNWSRTTATVTKRLFPKPNFKEFISSKGSLNARLNTYASRRYSIAGRVTSSFGTAITSVTACLIFENALTFDRDGHFFSVDFNVTTNTTTDVRDGTNLRLSATTDWASYPTFLALDYADFLDTTSFYARVAQALITLSNTTTSQGRFLEGLVNRQTRSTYYLETGTELYLGAGSQQFNYANNATNDCYTRDVQSLNDIKSGQVNRNVTTDTVTNSCAPGS